MDMSWREFEQLVARIETQLAPKGVTVRSPDKIQDKVTGQMREVDASIRYQIGSAPILITIECRERSAVQDDTWIEQLIMKRQKLGAQQTIAVSSSGFSGPAIESAQQNMGLNSGRLRRLLILRFLAGSRILLSSKSQRTMR